MKTKTAEWTYSYGYYSKGVLRELNDGFTVTDIGSHWAKNDIAYCAVREIFKGVSDTRFGPNDLATRAQMCTLLKRFAEQQGYTLTAILSAKQ